MKEISKDIKRKHSLVAELKTEGRIEMDKIRKCYGVVLADVWTETDIKKQILESYKAGQENPQDKESFINRYFPDFKLPNLQYDMRDISEIENYYLLSYGRYCYSCLVLNWMDWIRKLRWNVCSASI